MMAALPSATEDTFDISASSCRSVNATKGRKAPVGCHIHTVYMFAVNLVILGDCLRSVVVITSGSK